MSDAGNRPKFLTRLQTKLSLLLFLVGVIPMATGSLYAYSISKRSQAEDHLTLMQKELDHISYEIIEIFDHAKSDLLLTVQNRAFQEYLKDPEKKQARLKEIQNAFLYFGKLFPSSVGKICLVDLQGNEICQLNQKEISLKKKHPLLGSLHSFSMKEVDLDRSGIHQGSPYFSKEIGEWLIPTITRIDSDSGELLGYAHFDIRLSYFSNLLKNTIGSQNIAFISDSKGTILSSAVLKESPYHKDIGEILSAPDKNLKDTLKDIKTGGDGFRKFEVGGHEHYILYQPIPLPIDHANHWSVGFILPAQAMEEGVGGTKYVLFISVATLGIMGIAYYFGKGITQPIENLTMVSRAMASGNFHHEISVTGSDELGILGRAFKTMRDSLSSAGEREKKRLRQLGILNEVGVSFSSDETTMELLVSLIVETARKLVRSKESGIILLNPTTKRIETIHFTSDFLGPLSEENALKNPLISRLTQEGTSVSISGSEARFYQSPVASTFPTTLLGVPCIHKGKILGAILIADREEEGPYTQEDQDYLLTLAFQVSMVIERNRLFEQAKYLSVTDSLTGLFNHRQFHYLLEKEIERSERYNHQVSLLFLDIDHFKGINDLYGHPTGDSFLKLIGILIKEMIRNVDIPARYGGEEFGIILPETSGPGAYQLADSIREKIQEYEFLTQSRQLVQVTVSIGIATFPDNATKKETLISAADRALYTAKELGRNNVQRYQEALEYAVNHHLEKFQNMFEDPSLNAAGSLVAAMDAKVTQNGAHSKEVSKYALLLANAVHLDSAKVEQLRIASLLHDLGLVGIPEYILNKPGPLTPEERNLVEEHPKVVKALFTPNPQLMDIIPIIVAHHERFNGTGYPNGLKGTEIPYLSRILSIAEAYQAMTSHRPYRKRLSNEEAVQELMRHKGTQFDPELVDQFISAIAQFEYFQPSQTEGPRKRGTIPKKDQT